MKLATLGTIAAATLMLAACSGGDEPTGPTPSNTPTVIAEGETSTPGPSVGNTDDALCAAAEQNIQDATELEAKTTELTELMQDPEFLTGTDATVLNEWGETMLELTGASQDFYELGIAETEGDPVNADFVTLSSFVELYSNALAVSAAEATSTADFFTDMQDLFTEAEVREIGEAAPTAAQNVATYLGTRCDVTA